MSGIKISELAKMVAKEMGGMGMTTGCGDEWTYEKRAQRTRERGIAFAAFAAGTFARALPDDGTAYTDRVLPLPPRRLREMYVDHIALVRFNPEVNGGIIEVREAQGWLPFCRAGGFGKAAIGVFGSLAASPYEAEG